MTAGIETRGPDDTFFFPPWNLELPYFHHAHNCGFPPARHTERTVELAIADRWLRRMQAWDVWEVGAVTPYYWSHRVARVIDPGDPHPEVTDRQTLRAFDFTGQTVLSISTLEHVRNDEFYAGSDPEIEALQKLVRESACLLVTVPFGVSPAIDEAVFIRPADLPRARIAYMVRDDDETWHPAEQPESQRPYTRWANSIAVVEKGEVL